MSWMSSDWGQFCHETWQSDLKQVQNRWKFRIFIESKWLWAPVGKNSLWEIQLNSRAMHRGFESDTSGLGTDAWLDDKRLFTLRGSFQNLYAYSLHRYRHLWVCSRGGWHRMICDMSGLRLERKYIMLFLFLQQRRPQRGNWQSQHLFERGGLCISDHNVICIPKNIICMVSLKASQQYIFRDLVRK